MSFEGQGKACISPSCWLRRSRPVHSPTLELYYYYRISIITTYYYYYYNNTIIYIKKIRIIILFLCCNKAFCSILQTFFFLLYCKKVESKKKSYSMTKSLNAKSARGKYHWKKEIIWKRGASIPLPHACKACALPFELHSLFLLTKIGRNLIYILLV